MTTLNDLVTSANAVTDEAISFSTGVIFINDCIAKINVELNAKYPMYLATDSNATLPLPQKWQYALFIPFISAKIKQIDGSQFEYEDYYDEFFRNFKEFSVRMNVQEEYRVLIEKQEIILPDTTIYVTKYDETLGEIAIAKGTDVQTLLDLNPKVEFEGESYDYENTFINNHMGGSW